MPGGTSCKGFDGAVMKNCAYIQNFQTAMVREALKGEPVTSDVARREVPLPDDLDPNAIGPAVAQLQRWGIIKPVGFSRSQRSLPHGRYLQMWAVSDETKAQWFIGLSLPDKEMAPCK